MNSIAIVTDNVDSKLSGFLKENLKLVFEDIINITIYSFEELNNGKVIHEKVILVMIKERAIEIQKYLSHNQRVIVVQRTIKEEETFKLFSISKGMDVLVVNDNKETILETISLFYQLGINHLNFIPYNPKLDYSNIKIAVTPGEIQKVPNYIEKIIDVGDRWIDLSIFMKISEILNIKNKIIDKNIIRYSQRIVSLDVGIKEKYKELFMKNEELDIIINLSKDGIIFTSKDDEIVVCNRSFNSMFNLKTNLEGKNINDILPKNIKYLNKKDKIENEVIKLNNKYFNVNKESIYDLGNKIGTYYNIQEVTYIKQLEQNLNRKIKSTGQFAKYRFDDLKTKSSKMKFCLKLAKKISKSELTVLILGESGTGKEVIAQSIHNNSDRSKYPFIAVNCASMPENLLESELFGYEPGAFTGALKEGKKGLFEQANNGTIFLDEIGDMPLILQTKLLRVLQERQVMRIGSYKVIDINVRVIAATNKKLFNMIEKGTFREDLYYRINVLPIEIPPLRERKEDILPLFQHFITKELILSDEIKEYIKEYKWKGNIRELQNVAAYVSLMCEKKVDFSSLPFKFKINKNTLIKNNGHSVSGNDKSITILKILRSYKKENKSLGRKGLLKNMIDYNIQITEGEIRMLLKKLSDKGFVSSKVGRGGSSITEKGEDLIKDISSEI